MPELDLPQPTQPEELPTPPREEALPSGTERQTPLDYPQETEASGSWIGGLLILAVLFYFFAPASWKNWVGEQWQRLPWDKLPIEISVKVKSSPSPTVSPSVLPPLYEASPSVTVTPPEMLQ